AFNAAATWVPQVRWEETLTNTNTAHHRVYGETHARFGLGAQGAICARMTPVEASTAVKVVTAKRQEPCPQFGPCGRGGYDARPSTVRSQECGSLNTVDRRLTCRLVLEEC